MKRIKLVFGLALFCAMTFGALKAYDYTHTTESEKLLLANVEALTRSESGGGGYSPYCHAGGRGSTQCSIDAGVDIAGYGVSAGCSVTCSQGYACCSLRCTCVI